MCVQNEALPQRLGTTLDHSGGEPQAVCLQLRMHRTKIWLEGDLPVPACCRTVCALSTVNPAAFLPACSSRLLGTQQGNSLEGSPNQEGRIGMCRGCCTLLSTTHLTALLLEFMVGVLPELWELFDNICSCSLRREAFVS